MSAAAASSTAPSLLSRLAPPPAHGASPASSRPHRSRHEAAPASERARPDPSPSHPPKKSGGKPSSAGKAAAAVKVVKTTPLAQTHKVLVKDADGWWGEKAAPTPAERLAALGGTSTSRWATPSPASSAPSPAPTPTTIPRQPVPVRKPPSSGVAASDTASSSSPQTQTPASSVRAPSPPPVAAAPTPTSKEPAPADPAADTPGMTQLNSLLAKIRVDSTRPATSDADPVVAPAAEVAAVPVITDPPTEPPPVPASPLKHEWADYEEDEGDWDLPTLPAWGAPKPVSPVADAPPLELPPVRSKPAAVSAPAPAPPRGPVLARVSAPTKAAPARSQATPNRRRPQGRGGPLPSQAALFSRLAGGVVRPSGAGVEVGGEGERQSRRR